MDCLSGSGITYRGSATVPHCQPWAAFDTHVSQILNVGSLGSMWPGLSALNIHTFPVSLDTEASSSAVCRNPLGLASRPFCLGSIDVTSESQGNISQWSIFLCNDIALCSITGPDPNLISRVVVMKINSSELSNIHTQVSVGLVTILSNDQNKLISPIAGIICLDIPSRSGKSTKHGCRSPLALVFHGY